LRKWILAGDEGLDYASMGRADPSAPEKVGHREAVEGQVLLDASRNQGLAVLSARHSTTGFRRRYRR
jgi:hypothetical protein